MCTAQLHLFLCMNCQVGNGSKYRFSRRLSGVFACAKIINLFEDVRMLLLNKHYFSLCEAIFSYLFICYGKSKIILCGDIVVRKTNSTRRLYNRINFNLKQMKQWVCPVLEIQCSSFKALHILNLSPPPIGANVSLIYNPWVLEV